MIDTTRRDYPKTVRSNAKKLTRGARKDIKQQLRNAARGGNTDIFNPEEHNVLARAGYLA